MKIPSHTLIRAVLPNPIDTAIKHLAVDLGIPVTRLMAEGAILLLRYHQRADGLPPPMPPCPPGDAAGMPLDDVAKKPRKARKGGAR